MFRWSVSLALLCVIAGSAMGQLTQSAADSPPKLRLVSNIDVKDFGAETARLGDLNGDGAIDLLFVQSVVLTREITCLTATTIQGEVLWQTGKPSPDNGRIYADLPVQVYDWDDDGRNEVLYVRQAKYAAPQWDGKSARERADRYEGEATMVVLDGATGAEKRTFPLPAAADDCFIFADFAGRGRRQDLLVKDRYWNMWGVACTGEVLWHYEGSTGHFPALCDVNNDGREEVFVGYALVDHDGKVLFQHGAKGSHQDACWTMRLPDGQWRLYFGNTGMHCLKPDGTVIWEKEMGEAQHVVAGRFRADSPLQLAIMDRTPVPHRRDANAWGMLYLYDLDGREIWQRKQDKGTWATAIEPVNWSGPAQPMCVLAYNRGPGQPAVLFDGAGQIVETLPMQYQPYRTDAERQEGFYALPVDVWGDCRDEIILFGARGACIYANARPLSIPTIYNETLYPGM